MFEQTYRWMENEKLFSGTDGYAGLLTVRSRLKDRPRRPKNFLRKVSWGRSLQLAVSCHAPALFLRQPGEESSATDARPSPRMRRLGRVLDEIKPDALIVVGLDHLEAFSLDVSPAFAVVVGPEVVGSFGSKQYRVGVHQDAGSRAP